jgi:radical SAM superfamily enzyme YgiQ (UPF0313 family)
MRNILIISFDIIRTGECPVSYSIGSLLAYLRLNNNNNININHWSFNILDQSIEINLKNRLNSCNLDEFHFIAISNYIWCDHIVKELLLTLQEIGYSGNIILGGNQITYSDNLIDNYPGCKIFIVGYGELSLYKAIFIENKIEHPIILKTTPDFCSLPSPYLSKELIVTQKQKMVRMETKRGCPYKCNFCAHRDLNNTKIYEFNLSRIYSELNLFNEKKVQKINIIDPIFNTGKQYIGILKYMTEIRLKAKVAFQTRFELITGEKGTHFINLSSLLNVTMEFGVQTLIEEECKVINRHNNINLIKKNVQILNDKDIDYEINLIYGLPRQTKSSFLKSIDLLKSMNCKRITAHPLMLLIGTPLYYQKEKWSFKEKYFNDIPLIVESNSFSESQWFEMHNIAYTLNKDIK